MSSGFISESLSNPDEATIAPAQEEEEEDPWAKAEETIKIARWQQEEDESLAEGNEGKSLFEILQANKARKQEEFEEKLKFKNQFKPLDEDDVEFLDSIMSEQTRMEHLRKQELASQLDQFRKAQYEAENAGNAEALESIPKVEDIVPGGWSAGGRKRKKNATSDSITTTGAGLKIRKVNSVVKTKPKETERVEPPKHHQPEVLAEQPGSEKGQDNGGGSGARELSTATRTAPGSPTTAKPRSAINLLKPTSLLGLVTYSSDEDD